MTTRPLNTRFLLRLLLVLGVVCAAVYALHEVQMIRHARYLLARAVELHDTRPEQAVVYFSRYLTLVPGDTDVRGRYGLLLGRAGATPREREHALTTLQQVLAWAPDRQDLRRRVAALQMEEGAFAEARKNLVRLLESAPPDRAKLEDQL